MGIMSRCVSILGVLALSLVLGNAEANSIGQTRSVTIYEPVGAVWEIEHTSAFADRVKLAKKTGFNAVWLVVLWNELDPVPSKFGEIPLVNCVDPGAETHYQCALERALSAINDEGMDVFISLNYASAAASEEFKNASNGEILVFGDGPAKLYRYARYIARVASRTGVSESVRILLHDEGILGPYDSLWAYPEVQQSFRDYLYGLNPSLAYWNSRWGLSGNSALTSWAGVRTFSLQHASLNSPQLQDHVAWVNWAFRQSFGSGAFEATIREVVPGAVVGFHSTYFPLINPNGPVAHAPQPPVSSLSNFSFISVPYYDGPSNFGLSFGGYVDFASTFFQARPLLMGELGSVNCEMDSECPVVDGKFTTSLRVQRRQATFLSQAIGVLSTKGVGYNIWSLSEFPFGNKEGSFGIYQARPGAIDTATRPSFKPAACELRKIMGSTSQTPCLASGGINAQYNPRAVWISGRGFMPGLQVRLSNEAGTLVHETQISPTIGSDTSLSFQLSDTFFAQLGCGSGTVDCSIAAEAYFPQTGSWSNKVLIQVN